MFEILTPATTNNLTTRDTIKQELQISGTTQDDMIDRMIEEASSKITAYCRRPTFGREVIRQTTYFPEPVIVLERNPDLSPNVTSVTVGGNATTDFLLQDGMLFRLSTYGPVPWQSYGAPVVIEYETGYSLIGGLPSAIERACIDTVKTLYFAGPRDSQVKAEKVLDIIEQTYQSSSSQQTDSGLPPGVDTSLEPFRLEVVV